MFPVQTAINVTVLSILAHIDGCTYADIFSVDLGVWILGHSMGTILESTVVVPTCSPQLFPQFTLPWAGSLGSIWSRKTAPWKSFQDTCAQSFPSTRKTSVLRSRIPRAHSAPCHHFLGQKLSWTGRHEMKTLIFVPAPIPCKNTTRRHHLRNCTKSAGALVFDFPPPELWETNVIFFLINCSVWGILLQQQGDKEGFSSVTKGSDSTSFWLPFSNHIPSVSLF